MADIRDLALHLNISTGTVSRALNNRPGVNSDTRARVLEAALELGYVANQSGRSLRRGATNTIGFVVETGSAANQESGEFFFVLLDALHLYLAGKGYDLMILPCHSADDPAEFLGRLVARGLVDAVAITATRRHDRRIEMLTRSTLPFLTLGRSETPGAYPWIDLDFNGVARKSVAELVAQGHRRIAVALPDSDAMLGYHYRWGYEAAMAEAGLALDESLIFRNPTSEAGGFALGQQVAAARPTAVMLCSDGATVGLYAGLQSAGMTPGVDVSIITFRENPQLRFLSPGPSTFRVDVGAIGRKIGERILALLSPDPEARAAAARAAILMTMDYVPGASVTAPT
jgi:DNA-binding LacI/PurR family transcriptional regulator